MTNKIEQLASVKNRLEMIPTISVLQIDEATNSVGLTFEYLGTLYTTYINAESERGELLEHDSEDITILQNIGSIDVESLLRFFESLPAITQIAK